MKLKSEDWVARSVAFSYIENHRVDVIVNVSMMGEGYDHKYLPVAADLELLKVPCLMNNL